MMSYAKETAVLSGILKKLSYWSQHPHPPVVKGRRAFKPLPKCNTDQTLCVRGSGEGTL